MVKEILEVSFIVQENWYEIKTKKTLKLIPGAKIGMTAIVFRKLNNPEI